MKKIETLAAGANFAAVETGKMNELGDYVLELGPGVRIPGKVFGGAAVGATGAEVSLQRFAPGAETGFPTRSSTSSSRVAASSRSTGSASPSARGAWCAWRPRAGARCAMSARSR